MKVKNRVLVIFFYLIVQASTSIASQSKNIDEIRKEVYNITYGHIPARAIHIAAKYKIFGELKKSPKSSEDIARVLNLNAKNLNGLMMILANHKILDVDIEGIYSLNKYSSLLVSDSEDSILKSVAKESDIRRWEAIGNIEIAIKDGKTPFDEIYGEDFYEYLNKNPEAAKLFNDGMTNYSEKENKDIARLYAFEQFKTICDVGGSDDSLISKILDNNPDVQGIVLDLKSAILGSEILKDPKYKKRLSGIAGDFFNTVPRADAYIVKRVLHNWSDEKSVHILKNCVGNILDKSKGRIFVIEKIMPNTPDGDRLIDSNMISMALKGEPERGLKEFRKIGRKAGLEIDKVIKSKTGVSLIVFKIG